MEIGRSEANIDQEFPAKRKHRKRRTEQKKTIAFKVCFTAFKRLVSHSLAASCDQGIAWDWGKGLQRIERKGFEIHTSIAAAKGIGSRTNCKLECLLLQI